MAISVAMPTIMTMPIIAVMLSSTPVNHNPKNTALVEIKELRMMMTGSQKLS